MKHRDMKVRCFLSREERVADLLNVYLGENLIEPEDIQSLDTFGFVRGDGGQKIREMEHDVLKLVKYKDRYIIVGLEGQDHIHYQMVFRNISYTMEGYRRQLDKIKEKHRADKDLKGDEYLSGIGKNDYVYPVIILVVYFGQKPWDGEKSLYEITQAQKYPEKIRGLFPEFQINLLDIQRFDRVEEFQTDLKIVFGFLQRRSDKAELKKFVTENQEEFQRMREDAYDVLEAYSGSVMLKKMKEKYRVEGGYFDMCKALDDMVKEGEERGEERGEKRGEERMSNLVLQLLEEGRIEDIKKAMKNTKYRNRLYRQENIGKFL